MLLSQHFSAVTRAIPILSSVVGLSIALGGLGAQSVKAAQFFNFTTTWSDGSIGSGSFSLSETPTEARVYNELDADFFYVSKTWTPLSNFTYSYLGRTYTSASSTSFTLDEYPEGRYYFNRYGSFLKDFSFSLEESNFYSYAYWADAEMDAKDSFQGISQILDASNQVVSSSYLVGISVTEQPPQSGTPPEPETGSSHPDPQLGGGNAEPGGGGNAPELPQSQSVPEPGILGSLFLLGLGMTTSGRRLTAQRAASRLDS